MKRYDLGNLNIRYVEENVKVESLVSDFPLPDKTTHKAAFTLKQPIIPFLISIILAIKILNKDIGVTGKGEYR